MTPDAPTNLVGLGIGAVLLLLVFRTLWRQEDGWRHVLEAARQDAADARADAAAARADAAAARSAEAECRAQMAKFAEELAQLKARLGPS